MESQIRDPIAELLSYSVVKVKKVKPNVAKYFDLDGTKIKK